MKAAALLGGFALALLTSACATMPQQPPAAAPPTPAANCNAAAAQFAVGRTYSEALAEAVRQRSGAASTRALRPGQVVTMEYNAQRVNVDLDASGVVTRVRCG